MSERVEGGKQQQQPLQGGALCETETERERERGSDLTTDVLAYIYAHTAIYTEYTVGPRRLTSYRLVA